MKEFCERLLKFWPLILASFAVALWIYKHDMSLARAAVVNTKIEAIQKQAKQDRENAQQVFNDFRNRARADSIQKRIWELEKEFKQKPMPQSTQDEYHRIKIELQRLRSQGY